MLCCALRFDLLDLRIDLPDLRFDLLDPRSMVMLSEGGAEQPRPIAGLCITIPGTQNTYSLLPYQKGLPH